MLLWWRKRNNMRKAIKVDDINAHVLEVFDRWNAVLTQHNNLVEQSNVLRAERETVLQHLKETAEELHEKGQQLAEVVQTALQQEGTEVLAEVAALHDALKENYPEYLVQGLLDREVDVMVEMQSGGCVARKSPSARPVKRPDGTVPRRPARPKKPQDA